MIAEIRLKSGRIPGTNGEKFAAGPITIFVGPNNSGKSKILKEIQEFCNVGIKSDTVLILDELTFNSVDAAGAAQAIKRIERPPVSGERVLDGYLYVGHQPSNQLPRKNFMDLLQNPNAEITQFCQWYLVHDNLSLDGEQRINLVKDQSGGDLQLPPKTSLQILFRDNVKRAEVRRICSEAFGSYFVIDPTTLGQLRIRLAERPPRDDNEERGLNNDAVEYYRTATHIGQTSDGVKAFTGIVTEVIAGDPSVIIIDEPEAFLHPSLASKLGLEISRAAHASDKRVLMATHSASLIMGCIQSGAPVNIVRLTYRNGIATSRLLPSAEILKLMRNPLLRSTGMLNGLFYEHVVVTESDSDRAFYQEINERLLQFKPEWGIPNCLFINAQNKQTVRTLIQPLRQLGIPAAGIVDIDVIKEGGTVWTNLLSSASVPNLSHSALAAMRVSVKAAMDATGKNMKINGGVNILEEQDREAALNLLGQLADYGVFVVQNGELESWLKDLNGSGHGSGWLTAIFEKMGDDPTSADYLRPSDDDVWKFLFKIKTWMVDPDRRGIPA